MLSRPEGHISNVCTAMYCIDNNVHLANCNVGLGLRWLISLVHLFVLIPILFRLIIYTMSVSSPNVFQWLL